jgi:hypothetical protein
MGLASEAKRSAPPTVFAKSPSGFPNFVITGFPLQKDDWDTPTFGFY